MSGSPCFKKEDYYVSTPKLPKVFSHSRGVKRPVFLYTLLSLHASMLHTRVGWAGGFLIIKASASCDLRISHNPVYCISDVIFGWSSFFPPLDHKQAFSFENNNNNNKKICFQEFILFKCKPKDLPYTLSLNKWAVVLIWRFNSKNIFAVTLEEIVIKYINNKKQKGEVYMFIYESHLLCLSK